MKRITTITTILVLAIGSLFGQTNQQLFDNAREDFRVKLATVQQASADLDKMSNKVDEWVNTIEEFKKYYENDYDFEYSQNSCNDVNYTLIAKDKKIILLVGPLKNPFETFEGLEAIKAYNKFGDELALAYKDLQETYKIADKEAEESLKNLSLICSKLGINLKEVVSKK